MRIIISIIFSIINVTGLIAAATPRINKILKMLEPITFPSAISTSFFLAATIEVTSSERHIHNATIVRPIRVWLNPNPAAIDQAPLTTKSPPNLIAIIPPTIYNKHFHIGRIFISSAISSSSVSNLSPSLLAFFAE